MTKKTKSNSHFNLALNLIPGLFGLSPSFRFWFDSKNLKNRDLCLIKLDFKCYHEIMKKSWNKLIKIKFKIEFWNVFRLSFTISRFNGYIIFSPFHRHLSLHICSLLDLKPYDLGGGLTCDYVVQDLVVWNAGPAHCSVPILSLSLSLRWTISFYLLSLHWGSHPVMFTMMFLGQYTLWVQWRV